MNAFNSRYAALGLMLIVKSTEVLYQHQINCPSEEQTNIKVDNETLKNVETFTYLGGSLSSKSNIDAKIIHRLQVAGAAVGEPQTRVFNKNNIYKSTKLKVYNTFSMRCECEFCLHVYIFLHKMFMYSRSNRLFCQGNVLLYKVLNECSY